MDARLEQLASLAVGVGACVAPGQDVFVLACDVEQAPVVRAVAEEAYARVARYVSAVYHDQVIKRSRLVHAAEVDFTPDWWEAIVAECLARRGVLIVLWGDSYPRLFDEAGIPAERLALEPLPLSPSLLAAVSGGEIAWTLLHGPWSRGRGGARRRAGRRAAVGTADAAAAAGRTGPGGRVARAHRPPARARGDA